MNEKRKEWIEWKMADRKKKYIERETEDIYIYVYIYIYIYIYIYRERERERKREGREIDRQTETETEREKEVVIYPIVNLELKIIPEVNESNCDGIHLNLNSSCSYKFTFGQILLVKMWTLYSPSPIG